MSPDDGYQLSRDLMRSGLVVIHNARWQRSTTNSAQHFDPTFVQLVRDSGVLFLHKTDVEMRTSEDPGAPFPPAVLHDAPEWWAPFALLLLYREIEPRANILELVVWMAAAARHWEALEVARKLGSTTVDLVRMVAELVKVDDEDLAT